MNSFIKDTVSVGFSKAIIILSSLATSIIIGRSLGPEKNGIIAALLVYPSLFMSVGSLGIRQSTAFYLGKNIFSEKEIKTSITQIWVFSTLFSLLACFILMVYFSKSGSNLFWVILALIPIPFSLFNTYNAGIFLGKNQIGRFNKINWIPSLVILILTFVFVVLFSQDIEGYLMAMIGGPVFIFFILLFKNEFIHSFSLKFQWEVIGKMLKLGLIYAFALLIINLNYQLDVILLNNLSQDFQTGIYSKGAGIIQYLWQIPMMLSTIVFARSASSKNGQSYSLKVVQLLRVSFVIIGIVSIFLIVFSELIIISMYGEPFRASIPVLQLLLPGVLLLTIFKVMNMDMAGKGKPLTSLKAMFPALIVNLVLNIFLIPNYGAIGAALASTISYSLAAILFLFLYCNETNISIYEIFRFNRTDFAFIFQYIDKLKSKK